MRKNVKRKIIAKRVETFDKDGITHVVYEVKLQDKSLTKNMPDRINFDIEYLPSTLAEYMVAYDLSQDDVLRMLRYFNGDDDEGINLNL